MRTVPRLWLLGAILLLLSFFGQDAHAYQRMGVRAGSSVSIPPNKSGELEAFCLDEHAPPPTQGDRFTRVMNASSPKALVVDVGSRQIPLQEAIDKGMVRISGVDEGTGVFARIDAVSIKNLTKQPIVVRVTESAVLGGEGHESFGYNVRSLLDRHGDQGSIWSAQESIATREAAREATRSSQEKLSQLGLYRGKVDGEVNPATRRALDDFKLAHGLGGQKRKAPSEEEIEVSLTKSIEETEQRRSLAEKGVVMITVENTVGTRPLYLIRTPDGEIVYKGDKSAELAGRVNTYMDTRSAETVYLDLSRLPPHRIDGLKSSLKLSGAAHLRVLESARTSANTVQILRARDAKLTDISPISESPNGFAGQATLRSGSDRFIVRVISKSREAIQGFLTRLKELLGLPSDRHTVATAINKARVEMKRKFRLSDEEFDVQIGKEFEELEIVTAPHSWRIDTGG